MTEIARRRRRRTDASSKAIRGIAACVMLLGGAVFLIANTSILATGAAKYAHGPLGQLAIASAAGVVPWMIAVMTVMLGLTWRRVGWVVLPTLRTAVVGAVWLVFVAYNLANGAGVLAVVRQDTVAERAHDSATTRAMAERRTFLAASLEAIPRHRPAAAVQAEIEALKFARAYVSSSQCRDPGSRDQRAVCQQIARLESEMASGRDADRLQAQIAELDAAIARARPVIATADPQTELLHQLTGLGRSQIELWLPASTPIVLELGGAVALHFGCLLLGVTLRLHSHADEAVAESEPIYNDAPLPPPDGAAGAPQSVLDTLGRQRELVDWFFATCARPVAEGSLPESEWYDLYGSISRRHHMRPLPVESFRRIARTYLEPMRGTIRQIDGVWHYYGALPVVPAGAA